MIYMGKLLFFFDTEQVWKKINRADKVVCVSNYLEQAYQNNIRDKSKLKVVYDGIDMTAFETRRSGRPSESNIIIGLAGTAPIKNHKDAILALKKVHQAGHQAILKIAGRWGTGSYDRSYKDGLKDLIAKNELKDFVEFVGMQSDMNRFWAECDLSVVCSKRESFGLAATEAMVCGVPLVCSNTSISGELTENGKNILIYETGNSEELAACILEYINQFGTKELEDKTKRAATYVRENFSIENAAKNLMAVYEEVI